MRRIRREHLPPVVVFADDLEEICSYIKQLSNDIIISVDGYEFDDLNEVLSYHKKKVNNLEICSFSAGLSVCFHPNDVWVYSSDHDPNQKLYFEKIVSLLKERQNLLLWAVTGYVGLSLYGLLVLSLFIVDFNRYIVLSNEVSLPFIMILGVSILTLRMKNFSRVFLAYKVNNNLSFYTRNKDLLDSIVVSIVFLIIGHYWK